MTDPATPVQWTRNLAAAAVFLATASRLPNLEDVGVFAFVVLALCGLAFPLLALGGGVAALASRPEEARERAADVAEAARFAAFLFCVAVWTQWHVAPGPGWGLRQFLLALAAWRLFCDSPWDTFDRYFEARRDAAGLRSVTRYEAEANPAPAPPTPGLVAEPLLVSSGTFRVDRERMIDMLSRFQSADPTAFLLPWLRLAVASGARTLELSTRPDGLELTFDGRPLSKRWCQDPYAPLLEGEGEDDAEAERHKHLAYGLLALLPLGPGAVAVRSGSGSSRVVVTLGPKGAVAPAWPAPDGATSLRVALAGRRAAACLERAREAWGLADAELSVDGRRVPSWEPAAGVGERFEQAGVRGVVYRVDRGTPHRVHFYHLGARVPDSPESDFALVEGVAARVTYDGMRLDASLAKPVNDARLRKAARAAGEAYALAASKGRLGSGTGVLRSLAYTKAGLGSAAVGAVLAFALLMASGEARPELAWAAASVYVLVTAAVLVLLVRWALARLEGRRNPFR
ncbi:MAG: hypothetical protein HY553_14295 [Elusimicrobia bacterium]|nr:hypothetical protein [Elusimicrobiota bacterium]